MIRTHTFRFLIQSIKARGGILSLIESQARFAILPAFTTYGNSFLRVLWWEPESCRSSPPHYSAPPPALAHTITLLLGPYYVIRYGPLQRQAQAASSERIAAVRRRLVHGPGFIAGRLLRTRSRQVVSCEAAWKRAWYRCGQWLLSVFLGTSFLFDLGLASFPGGPFVLARVLAF